jgi:hypothetical protein
MEKGFAKNNINNNKGIALKNRETVQQEKYGTTTH